MKEKLHGIVVTKTNKEFAEWCRTGGVKPYNYLFCYPGRHPHGLHAIPVFFTRERCENDMHICEIIYEFQTWANKNFTGC